MSGNEILEIKKLGIIKTPIVSGSLDEDVKKVERETSTEDSPDFLSRAWNGFKTGCTVVAATAYLGGIVGLLGFLGKGCYVLGHTALTYVPECKVHSGIVVSDYAEEDIIGEDGAYYFEVRCNDGQYRSFSRRIEGNVHAADKTLNPGDSVTFQTFDERIDWSTLRKLASAEIKQKEPSKHEVNLGL